MITPNLIDFILKALHSISPNAQYTVGDTYDTLQWHSEDLTKPTEEEWDTALAKVQNDWTANEYARSRARAYDSVGDQLDQLMKDMRDGTTTHQTSCEAVKAKYPKP